MVGTVHTTGVNWESIAAITSCIVVVMSAIIGVFAKVIGNQITSSIDKFRVAVINQLDHRLTVLEVKVDTLRTRQTRDD